MFKFAVNAAVVAAMCLSVSAQGKIALTESIQVAEGETFDGQGKTYVSDGLGDGGQAEGQKPLFRLANGASLTNVRIGYPAADGVRCDGDANFMNVHWDDVGEDAINIGGVCDESTHTVVVDSCTMDKAEDKAFQVNARANIFIRNLQAQNMHRFLKAGVPVTVTIEDSVINGGPDAKYFIRAMSPSSKVYMKNTNVNFNKNTMLFFDMDESMFVDEGGNSIKGADGNGPEWKPDPNDECGFDGGQPGGGARGSAGGIVATPATAAAPAQDTVEEVPAEEETVEEVPAEEEPVEEVPDEEETIEEVPAEEEPVKEVPAEEEPAEEETDEEETDEEKTYEEKTDEDVTEATFEETDQVAAVEADDTVGPASAPLGVFGSLPEDVDNKPAKTPATISRLYAWLAYFKSSESAEDKV